MSNTFFGMAGKVVLITGAKRGLGRSYALAFAAAKVDVAICDQTLDDGQLEAVADEIKQLGQRALVMQVDVSCKNEVNNMVKTVVDELGQIDILVNNAGISLPGSLFDTEEDVWDRTIDTNLKGCYLFCQAVGRVMVERKQGVIINIASELVFRVKPDNVAYIASKAGVIALTRVLARELGQYNIRVNALAPGAVKTPMTENLFSDPAAVKEALPDYPLGRMGEVDDITGAALFLASEGAGWMTGHTLVVDGGSTA